MLNSCLIRYALFTIMRILSLFVITIYIAVSPVSTYAAQQNVKFQHSLRAYESRGYIHIESAEDKKGWVTGKQITTEGRCFDPTVSPDKRYVAYVKETPDILVNAASGDVPANEIWVYDVALDKHDLLLRGMDHENLDNFIGEIGRLQYSLDGKTIYFYSAAYATSGKIQAVDVQTKNTRYVIDGNSFEYIYKGKYAGNLLVSRHVYLDNGTEFSYWLISPTGDTIKRVCSAEDKKAYRKFYNKYIK